MTYPAVVPAEADVTVTASARIQHMCPFVREIDNGTITVTWSTSGSTFELHSLRAYLNSFSDAEISHEELTDQIRHDLSEKPGVTLLSVESSWNTAGMEVTCSTSPTPAVRP